MKHKIGAETLSNYAWYDPIFQQKYINSLGRTVDFHSLLILKNHTQKNSKYRKITKKIVNTVFSVDTLKLHQKNDK